ncbi:MAG: MdtA/MuxA family multidrug efflux RND transporter periplasmic adaptor subunit [Thermodesulfovibrionales bacterium]
MTSTPENMNDDTQEKVRPAARTRRWWMWLLAVCVLAAGVYFYFAKAPDRSAKQGPSVRSVPVVTAAARKGDIRIYLNGLGSVTPLNVVTVKSRVDGQLMKVLFREGQTVKSGDLLAEIDPRPFEVQLTQAEGQMARDQALLKNAVLDLKRYQVLSEQDSIPKQQLDTQEALVRQYEGAVKVDQGQIDNARLQLVYCRITSPIAGRVGLRVVDPGNIVHASDQNGLVVITQLQPTTIIFSIPEDNLPDVLRKLKAGQRIQVEAFNREQNQKSASGYLLTVDNQIDPTTGTVRLRAMFPNKENELFPNQFVNAHLLLDTKQGTAIVPLAAIQRSPKGAFVYVVKADKTAELRPVRPGPSEGDDISIEGLAPGESVVVEGADRLRDGSKVEIQGQPENKPRKAK